MPIKDALKMLLKIFHGNGTELMKDAPHFDSIVGVRIPPIVASNQEPVGLLTGLPGQNGLRRVLRATAREPVRYRR